MAGSLSPVPEGSTPGPGRGPDGFTLVEVLVAVAIMATAMTVIVATFVSAINAWKRGREYLEELHHGEIIMNQLTTALRSAAFFSSRPDRYGMRFTDGMGRYPADTVSWVCSGTAFLPPDSPLAGGLHRLVLKIESDEEGEPCLAAQAYPPLADEEELAPETWLVSGDVRGLDLRFYNAEDEIWEEDWEDTNSLPYLVEVSIYLDPVEEYGAPVILKRLVEIPVAPESGEGARAVPSPAETAAGAGETGGGAAEGEPVTTERRGRTTIIRR